MRWDGQRYMIDKPPSTISVAPVMNEASSEASHRIGFATSSGAAQRPINELSLRSPRNCSTDLPLAFARSIWKSVSVEPGQTALARMPCAASSNASVRVSASSPA